MAAICSCLPSAAVAKTTAELHLKIPIYIEQQVSKLFCTEAVKRL